MTTRELQGKISPKMALRELWKRGKLDYILHKGQTKVKSTLLEFKDIINVLLCSRQFGKTFLLFTMAIETCQSTPDAVVKYCCPKQSQGERVLRQNMKIILKDCPLDLRPEWKASQKAYIFHNGSEIQVAGTDNKNHENLRGGHAAMCIVDEAGFCDELSYIVRSILRPTVLHTGGKIFLVSTPSKFFSHEFIQDWVLPFKASGKLVKYNIHDNPMLTKMQIEGLKSEYPGGEENAEYRREYLCDIVNDASAMVIPEFDEKKQHELVKAWKRPPYYDAYTSGDVGFRDLTVYLFGYWDFLNATLVIEDELVMNGPTMTTDALAKAIKEKEQENFQTSDGTPQKPYMRVMDNNLIMVNDLNRLHQLNFLATEKDNKEAQINQVRMMLRNNQIRINPKCKHLIYHLQNAVWKNSQNKAREFAKISDTPDFSIRGGHADAVDALIYLVRNLVRTKNPYPNGYGVMSGSNVFSSRFEQANDTDLTRAIKSILNLDKKQKTKLSEIL